MVMRSLKRTVGGKIRSVYRAIFTTEFDHYDTDQIGSLQGSCVFCDVVMKVKEERNMWYEDDRIMVFEDIRPESKCHGLVIPKRHIRDIFNLRPTEQDFELLGHMEAVGLKILQQRHQIDDGPREPDF